MSATAGEVELLIRDLVALCRQQQNTVDVVVEAFRQTYGRPPRLGLEALDGAAEAADEEMELALRHVDLRLWRVHLWRLDQGQPSLLPADVIERLAAQFPDEAVPQAFAVIEGGRLRGTRSVAAS